jgi:hypothetical protein
MAYVIEFFKVIQLLIWFSEAVCVRLSSCVTHPLFFTRLEFKLSLC